MSTHEFVAEFRREVERLALENRDLRAQVSRLEQAARAGAEYIAKIEAEAALREVWGGLLDDPKLGEWIRQTYTIRAFFVPYVEDYLGVWGIEEAKKRMREHLNQQAPEVVARARELGATP